jgi:uncharacterized protein YcaQ
MRRLTTQQVRRAHIAAQGLDAPRPRRPNLGHVKRAIRTMGVLQIDSVNVVERAHQLTLFSRLGPYDVDLLWRALGERDIFEYWAHVASFSPIEDWPIMRHRMSGEREWRAIKRLKAEAPGYIEAVYREVVERGPLTASDLEDPGERQGPWWGWADGKHVLEWLFMTGRVSVAERRNFTRYYDISERVIPDQYRDAAPMPESEALRALLMRAAERVAVGTAKDLVDYFRLQIHKTSVRPAALVRDLAAEGALIEVEVEGLDESAYMHPDARIPRAIDARALLNPFDPIVWFRPRTEQIYHFHYRIEIYTPRPKRIYGYYVFPFLLGDELVGRVDLKADRKAGVLRVPGAFLEDGQDETRTAHAMAEELRVMAQWLGLGDIAIGRKGNLASALRSAVTA